MQISVTCASCHKKYQVDEKLAGRKVKCKSCGQVIQIPAVEAPAADDLLAGLNAAVQAEQGQAPDLSYPAPPAPPPMEGQGPDFGMAPPPMPPASFAPAPVAARRVAVQYEEDDRDYRGYRLSRDHNSAILNTIDNLTVTLGQVVFWVDAGLVMLFAAFFMWGLHEANEVARNNGRPTAPGWAFLVLVFLPPISLVYYLVVLKPCCEFAAKMAGKIMLFELPEEPRWRLVAVDVMSSALFTIGMIFVTFAFFFGEGLMSPRAAASIYLLMLASLPISIPLHFLLTWLTLRLKFLEALLAWAFIGIAMIVVGGIYLLLVTAAVTWAILP